MNVMIFNSMALSQSSQMQVEDVGFILGGKHCRFHVATRFSGDILHFARPPVHSAGKQGSWEA